MNAVAIRPSDLSHIVKVVFCTNRNDVVYLGLLAFVYIQVGKIYIGVRIYFKEMESQALGGRFPRGYDCFNGRSCEFQIENLL